MRSLDDLAVWGAFFESRDYGDLTRLIQYLEEGQPEIVNSPEIRKFLADRLRGVPLLSKGEKFKQNAVRERRDIGIGILMASHIADGLPQYSGNEKYQTAAKLTAAKFNVSESVVIRVWKKLKAEYASGSHSHVLLTIIGIYGLYRNNLTPEMSVMSLQRELREVLSRTQDASSS